MRYLQTLYVKIFARPSLRRFNTILLNQALRGLGILNFQNDRISGERYIVQEWLARSINRKNAVLFDVGANIGDYTRLLVATFPQASVHAFEPHPKTFSRLSEREFSASNIVFNNAALGDAEGVLRLFDYADNDGSQHASFHEATMTVFYKQDVVATEVQVFKLDDYCARNKIDYIDFLKIDTEGHEMAVLVGAERMLREGRIGPIQFEFNALNVFSRVFLSDFRALLTNYKLHRLLPNGLLELDTNPATTELFAFQNILAVPTIARDKTA